MSILIKSVSLEGERKDIYIEENTIKEISGNICHEAEFEINGKNKAAIPSFINAHTHAAMTLFRGYADDMALKEWLENKIWPIESKLTEHDVYWGTKLACLEMIKSGTTFFNDMYWHYHGTAKAVDESGIRAAVSAVFLDFFDKSNAEEQIKLNKRLFKETKKYKKVIFTLGPHAIYSVSMESLQWIKEFADKNKLLIHMHLAETKKEIDDCIKEHKKRPAEYLEDIGFLADNVMVAHAIWLNDTEIKILKKEDVTILHTPISNMKLSSGVFPYKKLRKAGVTIAFGTDGCASSNNLNMFEVMKFSSLLQKLHNNDPTIMPASEAFALATINGAKAFNLNCGEIKEGKLADLLLIDLKDVSLNPNHNLISNLVYSAGRSCVDTTICDGKVLMQNRRVDGEEEILNKVNEVAIDLFER